MPKKIPLFIFPILLFLLILAILGTYEVAYWQKIFPGVKVANIDLGNKSKDEATNLLLQKINQTPKELIFEESEKNYILTFEEIKLQFDVEKTVEDAFETGRRANPLTSLVEQKTAWFSHIDLPVRYKLDYQTLEEKNNIWQVGFYLPHADPQIKVIREAKSKKIDIEPSKAGRELNREKLLWQIDKQLSRLDFQTNPIPIDQVTTEITQDQIETTKAKAEKLLNKSLKLSSGDNTFNLKDEDLIDFLSFQNNLDETKLNQYLKDLSRTVNRAPQNAAFKFENNRVTVFKPAKEGVKLDEEALKKELQTIFVKLENEEAKEFLLSIPVSTARPQVLNEDVNNLGINELLARGTSTFRGSIPSRVHNILLAASRLNGLLVAPDETFSFNQSLGEISKSTGFEEAYIIKSGRTVLGDGGGVCQVSTTLFRAVLNAGLPVEERKAHAYRVSYYEQDSSPGLDATVFENVADLKFKNDTQAYILIQTLADPKNSRLTFELYGTPDGRKATISKSKVWDTTPPPPDLYQDDPTLPAGTTKQVDFKAWGAKVSFDWQVVRNGEILQKRTFYSNYKPWQAVFLKGAAQ